MGRWWSKEFRKMCTAQARRRGLELSKWGGKGKDSSLYTTQNCEGQARAKKNPRFMIGDDMGGEKNEKNGVMIKAAGSFCRNQWSQGKQDKGSDLVLTRPERK